MITIVNVRRFLKGIIYAGVVVLFVFDSGVVRDHLWSVALRSNGGFDWVVGFQDFMGLLLVPYFVVGLYFIKTCHVDRVPTYENSWADVMSGGGADIEPDGTNIQGMMNYRNSILSTKTRSEGASEYMKSAWLDGVASGKGKHTRGAVNYINSKLASMDNAQGYEWVKRGGK